MTPAFASMQEHDSEQDPGAVKHTYQTCSLIASEQLTSLQLYQRHVPIQVATETLPDISPGAVKRLERLYSLAKKQGIVETYSAINASFAGCAKSVYKSSGKPAATTREHGFYFCAGENKLRYEILLAVHLGGTEQEILSQLPETRREAGKFLYDFEKENGIELTFDLLATEFKDCLNKLTGS